MRARRDFLTIVTMSLLSLLRRRVPAAEGRPTRPATFGEDLAFLRRHMDVVVLGDADGGARVAVAPGMQGRVMTSTATGDAGRSFGWINRALIASGERRPHINAFGGEDRFWVGPEGGQFGFYFPPGSPFDLASWQTPEPIDWGAWETVSSGRDQATFARAMELVNHSGARFEMRVSRRVRTLGREAVAAIAGCDPGKAAFVAFESENSLSNSGTRAWEKSSGLVSIWILGMFQPSAATAVVVPYRQGAEAELGPVVNDAYFGKIPDARLRLGQGVLFFRADGCERGKIGLSPARTTGMMGSYAADARALTLVAFTLPSDARDYVNSMWEMQREPYRGDAANSYNDGPPEPGAAPLGPFYELESSSPAAALAPGEQLTHAHRTAHFVGEEPDLDRIARAALGVDLATVRRAIEGGG